jgi:hypothetical protein
MTFALSAAHNDARLEGTRTFADTGTQNSRIHLYATAQPATGADPGGAPLVTLRLSKPCGVVTAGSLLLTQAEVGGDLIMVTGSVLWARWVNGDDVLVADGTVSDSAGAGDIKLDGTAGTLLYAGAYALLGSATLG